ncbi:MAG: 2-oxoglutarate dehydrogenase complex dihydrolipoyllysine-residue succinyltransferase, partial [Pseudomonadota bacterium]
EIKAPVLPESVADATLLNWHKHPGDAVQEGENLVDLETDKVILEVVAPQAGTLIKIIKADGENVLSSEVIAQIDTSVVTPKPTVEPVETVVAPVKTSPAVRKMAAEQSIEPSTVPHYGDRVTKADMLQQPKSSPILERQESKNERPEERVPMTRLRKRVAERLVNAQHDHAILTTFNEINMKAVIDLRNKYKTQFEKKHGVKLGFMSFFAKAAIAALQKFPVINASSEGDDIIYHGYYDIGIAVSTVHGLVVPILRDVDAMSFAEIEKGITDFARRARDAQLSLDDLTGGTFSITNGGVFGSMLSTPILNPPQSAILGMHTIVERPVAENEQVVIRPVMYVALSYDHRLIDGREAVQFLVTLKNAIEEPSRLLLDI